MYYKNTLFFFLLNLLSISIQAQTFVTSGNIVKADNKVGIGTTLSGALPADANQFRLFVKDGIRTEKVKVDLA